MNKIDSQVEYLRNYDGPEIKIMEVCGTHTASIFRTGIRSFLSPKIKLISGPGCPVCVTESTFIDNCIEVSTRDNHVLLSFGDMLKVPGTNKGFNNSSTTENNAWDNDDEEGLVGISLSEISGIGGKVEMIYSPFDALRLAKENPSTTFVIASVGFETTAPAYALLIDEIADNEIHNIKFITALKLAIPAIEWICKMEDDIDGFLCPGHVSVITGSEVYMDLAEKYSKKFVIAGFEGNHLVESIFQLSQMIEKKDASSVKNLYKETVSIKGNIKAQDIISKYYDKYDAVWRGIGVLPFSGLKLKTKYEEYEVANLEKATNTFYEKMPKNCRCSDVIIGRINPNECPSFGKKCKPGTPYGPCMVSSEGACGIWYRNI